MFYIYHYNNIRSHVYYRATNRYQPPPTSLNSRPITRPLVRLAKCNKPRYVHVMQYPSFKTSIFATQFLKYHWPMIKAAIGIQGSIARLGREVLLHKRKIEALYAQGTVPSKNPTAV